MRESIKSKSEFYRFTSLSVVLTGSGNIPGFMFSGCGFKSVTIPEGVTRIEESAFHCCGGLKKITIPTSLTRIEESAFHCCGLKSITLGNAVRCWSEASFHFPHCESLHSAYYRGGGAGTYVLKGSTWRKQECAQNTQQPQIIYKRSDDGLYNVYINKTTGIETICEIPYVPWLNLRYVLGEKLPGRNNQTILYCIGAKPRKADVNPKDGSIIADQTICKIRTIFDYNQNKLCLGSWQMLNISPQFGADINDYYEGWGCGGKKNMEYFTKIQQGSFVWAAWGGLVEKSDIFQNCLTSIVQILRPKNVQWVKLKSPAKHPEYPLRCSKDEQELVDFNIDVYLENLKKELEGVFDECDYC